MSTIWAELAQWICSPPYDTRYGGSGGQTHLPRRGFIVTPDHQFQRVVLPARFEPLPRRWVVERSFAWIGRQRRMSKYKHYRAHGHLLLVAKSRRLDLIHYHGENEKFATC